MDLDTGLAHDWPPEMLAAAQDLLAGRITNLPRPTTPLPATLLGLHPHADRTLRGPRSVPVVGAQLQSLLHSADVHPGTD